MALDRALEAWIEERMDRFRANFEVVKQVKAGVVDGSSASLQIAAPETAGGVVASPDA